MRRAGGHTCGRFQPRSSERAYVALRLAPSAQGRSSQDRRQLVNCLPFNVIMAVLSFAIVSGVTHSLARGLFHGGGRYPSLLYAFASFYAPLYILSSLVSGILYLNCLYVLLLGYTFLLGATAIRAIHGIGWGQAVVSFLTGLMIVFGVVAVFTFCTLALLLGPSIGDGFQNNISGPASVQF